MGQLRELFNLSGEQARVLRQGLETRLGIQVRSSHRIMS